MPVKITDSDMFTEFLTDLDIEAILAGEITAERLVQYAQQVRKWKTEEAPLSGGVASKNAVPWYGSRS